MRDSSSPHNGGTILSVVFDHVHFIDDDSHHFVHATIPVHGIAYAVIEHVVKAIRLRKDREASLVGIDTKVSTDG